MSDLMWKSDGELLSIMRACKHSQIKLEAEIEELERKISAKRSTINNQGTQIFWATKYLMHDMTGTRYEHNVEGWLEQRSTNRPVSTRGYHHE